MGRETRPAAERAERRRGREVQPSRRDTTVSRADARALRDNARDLGPLVGGRADTGATARNRAVGDARARSRGSNGGNY